MSTLNPAKKIVKMKKFFTNEKGFSLLELLAVMAIVAVLSGIAVPIVLSQRNTTVESNQKSDLLKVSEALTGTLSGWNGLPPAQTAITTTASTWRATTNSTTVARGQVSAGSNIIGTIWLDGSYCLTNTGSTGTQFTYRSDTSTIQQNSPCPSIALGGVGATVVSAATADLPTQITGLVIYSPIDHQLSMTWAALDGATSYVVEVTGGSPLITTSNQAIITGLPIGPAVVTVYAKNVNGTGPGVTMNTEVSTSVVTPKITTPLWNNLPLSGSWKNYSELSDYTVLNNAYGDAQYTKAGGIVQVRGLVTAGTITAGTVIATLPAGYRPDYTLRISTNNANTPRVLIINPAGQISIDSGFNTQWFNLDNILFPAAGVADWINLGASTGSAFSWGWSAYNVATYGPPRFWADKDGIVWLGGQVGGGTVSNGYTIASLPIGTIRPSFYQHMVTSSASGYGGIAVSQDGILVKPNSSNVSLSLDGAFYATAFAQNSLAWTYPVTLGGTWIPESATFPRMGYAQTSYGLVILQGLGKPSNGTWPSPTIYRLPDQMRPNHRILRNAMSADTFARFDIQFDGSLIFGTGSSWGSMDSMGFFPQ